MLTINIVTLLKKLRSKHGTLKEKRIFYSEYFWILEDERTTFLFPTIGMGKTSSWVNQSTNL